MEELMSDISGAVKCVIQNILKEYFDESSIYQCLKYVLDTTGKMKRACFCFLCCKFVDKDITLEKVANILASIELMHLASLVHDDVIDKAEVRRKKETINSVFGEHSAIITGDMLIFLSQKLSINWDIEYSKKLKVLELLNNTYIQMCIGEENEGMHTKGLNVSLDSYFDTIKKKTAVFFENICIVGGVIAGATEEQLRKLSDFGLNYGLAYQIKDDLQSALLTELDDKSLLCDYGNKLVTLPIIVTYNECTEEEKTIMSEYYLSPSSKDYTQIVDLVHKYNTNEIVCNIIEKYKGYAINNLNYFNSEYKELISTMLYIM